MWSAKLLGNDPSRLQLVPLHASFWHVTSVRNKGVKGFFSIEWRDL
jgi:hypothetical protein